MFSLKMWAKFRRSDTSLQRRFLLRVLLPPFLVLLALGSLIIWQLNIYVRTQAINELKRASGSTSSKLEREFAIRKTILQRTGEELFTIKSTNDKDKAALKANYDACSAYIKQSHTFKNSPNGACDSFLASFAVSGATQAAIDTAYTQAGQNLSVRQNEQINKQLSAYKLFFPETVALIVTDSSGGVSSSALSSAFNGSVDLFNGDAAKAKTTNIEGKYLEAKPYRLAVFAYPIAGGSVLAAYDLDSASFIKQTWESTPIDRKKALSVIMDAQGKIMYPPVSVANDFTAVSKTIRNGPFSTMRLKNVSHIVVGSEAGSSHWLVAVASPKTTVLAPARDAQLAAVFIIGSLLVGFLWVGVIYIRKTVQSILRLVFGAVVFANNNLNYQIKLGDADQEFIKLADTMNAMAARIAATDKEIDEKNKEFISLATHELRTPLTAIMGNLSMVVEDMSEQLDDKTRPLLQEAAKGTQRMREMVNDMLDIARLEGGRVEFEVTPQPIGTIVKDVVDTLTSTAQDAGISLHYDNPSAELVLADASKLRIVLNNFVSNAIKYNRPDGSVTIAHSNKDGHVVTGVTDTGLGIPEDQKLHMFEKFYRVKTEERKNIIGTGLGMYITKQYVEAMGGKIWFESTAGKGSTFYFSLPISEPK